MDRVTELVPHDHQDRKDTSTDDVIINGAPEISHKSIFPHYQLGNCIDHSSTGGRARQKPFLRDHGFPFVTPFNGPLMTRTIKLAQAERARSFRACSESCHCRCADEYAEPCTYERTRSVGMIKPWHMVAETDQGWTA